jgi:glucose-1-phosphate cytidylyltransferase
MKVVIFCGGLGLRLRDHSTTTPKPLVRIGGVPILWHEMRYYAHHGHRDFILCLGYKGDVIKEYFLSHNEALSNDFVLSNGGRDIELLQRDMADWRVSFIDTGLRSNIGQRLHAVREHLAGEEVFLANYGDVLTDAPLNDIIEDFLAQGKVAAMLSVQPSTYTFHLVRMGDGRQVRRMDDVRASDLWINGGHFVFRKEIFDYIRAGEDLVLEPFDRLIEDDQLLAYKHRGFWAPLDTLKDLELLESRYEAGQTPWTVWRDEPSDRGDR